MKRNVAWCLNVNLEKFIDLNYQESISILLLTNTININIRTMLRMQIGSNLVKILGKSTLCVCVENIVLSMLN